MLFLLYELLLIYNVIIFSARVFTTAADVSACVSLSLTGIADNCISLPSGMRRITCTEVGVAAFGCPDEPTAFSAFSLLTVPLLTGVKLLLEFPESTTTDLQQKMCSDCYLFTHTVLHTCSPK